MCLLMGPTCSKMGRVSKEMFEEGNKEKEYIGISMEMSIKESGKTIWKMEKEKCYIQAVQDMKETG